MFLDLVPFIAIYLLVTGTYLDSSRFRVALATKLGINAQSVHAWIIGEHGDSSVPVWSGVNIAGINIKDALTDFDSHEATWTQVHEDVKSSAYRVIQCKGMLTKTFMFLYFGSEI
jgi:L-lactate dehydrogenase